MTSTQWARGSHRTFAVGALSAAVVLAPASAAVGVLVLAGGLRGSAATQWPSALLQLACVALALVLAWATAAAAAGVRAGWLAARPTHSTVGGRPPHPAPPARPGGLVTATVAALVVAALSAPSASAASGSGSPGTPVMVAVAAADPGHDDVAAPSGAGLATSTGATTAASPPGSWSALAGTSSPREAFRGPRTVDPGSVPLVTGQDTRSAPTAAEVVVRAGDSLWSLTARHLGPGATDAEVAATWPSWWQHNRAVIGDDPDLLLPGQTLAVPAP